jgi:hypothetical protein
LHGQEVRDLLVEADDLGEAYVEEDDPATGARFVGLSAKIDERFDHLQRLATRQERQLAAEAERVEVGQDRRRLVDMVTAMLRTVDTTGLTATARLTRRQ